MTDIKGLTRRDLFLIREALFSFTASLAGDELDEVISLMGHVERLRAAAPGRGQGSAMLLPIASGDKARVFLWDWKGQPDMEAIATAVKEISGGSVTMREVTVTREGIKVQEYDHD